MWGATGGFRRGDNIVGGGGGGGAQEKPPRGGALPGPFFFFFLGGHGPPGIFEPAAEGGWRGGIKRGGARIFARPV